ncbi:MAG: hypothetical protein COW55_09100 [Rhodobacteraceae bacterium CG17_big_fil_post_rev_8_21_14_2_50_65_11]|nr:MAG: hypothetical protein COW55_09100 [Rhodobacteraceae bacterium CG17_big_fil_post_rev_8_21_14_2_50_65_11]
MPGAATFWDRFAPKYAASPIRDVPAYEATLQHTTQHLAANDRVLEIGCGTGSTALRLAPHVAQYVASDLSGEMLAIAREKAEAAGQGNLSFEQAAADCGQLPEGPFDAVLAFSILHLLDDLDRGLSEVRAVLKPGGLLISKTVCLGGVLIVLRPVVGAMARFGKAPHLRFLTGAQLRARIEAAGFEIVESRDFHNSSKRVHFVARKI